MVRCGAQLPTAESAGWIPPPRRSLHGEHVRITVEDNGPGIPETVRAHISGPLFPTKPTGIGTGLGLSLSYDVTQGHGGSLDVKSADGRGPLSSPSTAKPQSKWMRPRPFE